MNQSPVQQSLQRIGETWLGIPLPEPDDPRIALFAERNTIATREIETTHHVAWVAGVKR